MDPYTLDQGHEQPFLHLAQLTHLLYGRWGRCPLRPLPGLCSSLVFSKMRKGYQGYPQWLSATPTAPNDSDSLVPFPTPMTLLRECRTSHLSTTMLPFSSMCLFPFFTKYEEASNSLSLGWLGSGKNSITLFCFHSTGCCYLVLMTFTVVI